MSSRVVDIRIYKLKQGSGATFHRLAHEESIPMVREWGHDVLVYGQSEMDPDCYYVIRAYDSLAQMQSDQDAFYSSEAWRKGPREAIVSLIEEQAETVLELSEEAIDAMRAGFAVKRPS